MKLKAFRIKDTGDALLLANRRPDPTGIPPVQVWVPRSIIDNLRIFGLRPGQEGMPNMVHADIPGWFIHKTPNLELFLEV